ncbi:uncharacterized protein LOC123200301 isoform X3 [Mangifera indica]|nr:uncharacterized protein LOC123200301 isoform X3 [Mangifera indica]
MVSLYTGENGDITSLRIGFKEDAVSVVHLEATLILINACNIEQLEKIPRRLSECFLVFLKELWLKVRYQMLFSNIIRSTEERHFCVSNITVNTLAESTFRLALNVKSLTKVSGHQMVKRSIFDSREATFEKFMLNYWEVSPFLIRRDPDTLIEENDLFSSFAKSININESFHSFLSSTIQCLISCLPIASDELNILSFLKEVRNRLGCPLIYDQDMRVLRTEKHSRSEVHFFPGCLDICSIKAPYFIYGDDFSKCEEACKEGYTISVRGMEFRIESVAAISDSFASLFGQPSVGANMYLTPPNSQGLACHYDDHCVFVCQLFGSKQWKVFSQPCVQLPRLYYPRAIVNGVEVESSKNEYRQFSLEKGDILYIPRGFLHEACTDNGKPSESAGYSLHLTLGIEVEPPFEWEGFAHVALYCWSQAQEHHESLTEIQKYMSVNLLHLVILQMGDSDPTFRKACLVAAVSLPLETDDWLYLNQKTIFTQLIDKISSESRFLEVLSSVEMDIRKNVDPFQRVRWLQFLDWKKEPFGGLDGNSPFRRVETMLPSYVQNKCEAEAAFMQVKSKFCREISFENVIGIYLMLLEKYRKTRKQYMNGMLALHCN